MKLARLVFVLFTAVAGAAVHAAAWQTTAPMLTARGGAGVIEVDGRLYAIGGVDGVRFLASGEYTTIQADGTLAPWQATGALNEERGFFAVAAHRGYLYAVGGGNGPNGHNLLRSVERAAIQPDGSLGPWQREREQLKLPRRCAKVLVIGDHLYAFGGFGGSLLDSIERAPILADGGLGPWELVQDPHSMPRYIHAMATRGDELYAIGGHTEQGGAGIAAVERARLDASGQPGAWQAAASLQHGRYGLAALSHGEHVYALGGLSGATFYDVIEQSRVGADGALDAWREITPLPLPLADLGVASYRDWLYVLGGTNRDGYFDSVFVARFDGRGGLAAVVDAPAAASAAPAPAKPVLVPNEGVVVQTLDGGAYTYVEVDTAEGREWLAAAKTTLAPGDRVRYSLGIFMKDFFSSQLQRRFDLVRFVGKLEKAAD